MLAKCCKMWKIQPCKVGKFCILFYYIVRREISSLATEDIDHMFISSQYIEFCLPCSRPFARHLKDGEIFRIYEK